MTDHKRERAVDLAAPPIPECQWFAGCHNPAIRAEPHPILGSVPICGRCTDWVRRMSAERSTDND